MWTFTTRNWNPVNPFAPTKTHTVIYIFSSCSTMIQSVLIKTYGMFIINGLGNTTLTDIALYHSDLEVFYINDGLTTIQRYSNHILQITRFKFSDNKIPRNVTVPKKLVYIIVMEYWQECYNTEVYIKDSAFQFLKQSELIDINFLYSSSSKHFVTIERCQFLNNSAVSQNNRGMITVTYPWYDSSNINEVQIFDCNFLNNTPASIINLYLFTSYYETSYFTISNCSFTMNSNFLVLNIPYWVLGNLMKKIGSIKVTKAMFGYMNYSFLFCTITINNSVFIQTGSGKDRTVICCCHAVLNLNGPLVFKNLNI